jgi:hypothetical protein
MLFSTTTLLLALAPAILAAPTANVQLGKRQLSDHDRALLSNGNCDLTNLQMPPGSSPHHLFFKSHPS